MEAAVAQNDAKVDHVNSFWDIIRPIIIYEDEHLVCINKPSGMLSVPGKVATTGKRDRQEEWLDAVRSTLKRADVVKSLCGAHKEGADLTAETIQKLCNDDRIPRKRAKFCSFLHRCHRIPDSTWVDNLFDTILASDRSLHGFQYGGRDLSTVSVVELLTETIGPVHVCHRLDQETSGVLLLAKTEDAHRELSRQFREREPQKAYIARLEGVIEDAKQIFTVDVPIRADVDHRPYQIVDLERGKASITHVRVDSRDDAAATSTVHLYPVTGRTHQLRLHMQHIGHAILGDSLYGSVEGKSKSERLLLHAHSLAIRHPSSGEPIVLVAPCAFADLTVTDLSWVPSASHIREEAANEQASVVAAAGDLQSERAIMRK